jgi:HSP20 family protein
MSIIRYRTIDPFQGFQEAINRMLVEPTAQRPGFQQDWVPPVDIRETENELTLKADIPDVKFEDIDVRLENGTLTLRGERKFASEKSGDTVEGKKDGGWHRVERSYGSFERVFTLPETVNPESVQADYRNGTLTITLPKKEIAKSRQIKVQVSHN